MENLYIVIAVDEPLSKLTSKSVMMKNGWMIDVDYSNGEDWQERNYCESGQFYGYKEGNPVGSVSAIFKGSGKANLRYANCYKDGYVIVSLNGIEIDRAEENIGKHRVSLRYEKGDLLEIKEVNTGIIKLYYLDLMDGGEY